MSVRPPAAAVAIAVLATIVLIWSQSYAASAPPGGRRDVPPEVIANCEVARERMERIVRAINMFLNNYPHTLPPQLSVLYPDYIEDPLVFWHPGDSDPPPTTIDNDIPDAPNSALISFEVDLTIHPDHWPGNQWYIRDNSAANNGGLFVSELWFVWETDPPGMMPWPTATTVAQRNLRVLMTAVKVYANDNYDWFPTDSLQLAPLFPPEHARRLFWHPGDDQPMPTEIDNSELNALNSTQISFEYLAAGLREGDDTDGFPFFRDNSSENNGGFGTFYVLDHGRVVLALRCRGDATGDRQVDFADFLHLGPHLGQSRTATLDRGDLDGDSHCDLRDVARLQQHFGESCPDVSQPMDASGLDAAPPLPFHQP